jgi:hypothetical protein
MQSLNYAQGRLAMARAMCDHSEIEKWREHVEYWQSKLAAEEADRANEEVCKTCNGIKYIPATKSTPDKQCPECKGCGLTPREPDKRDSASPIYVFSVRDLSTKKGLS